MNDLSAVPVAQGESGSNPLAPHVQDALTAHLRELAAMIAAVTRQVAHKGATHIPVLLALQRAQFYRAMTGLGDWINQFLAGEPSPAAVESVRQQVVTQIRAWSGTSPLLQHSLGKPRGKSSDPELVRWLLDQRPAGADIPALVLNDFYRHSVGGLAYRARVALLVAALRREVARRAAAAGGPVRILSLHISGADELLTLADDETFAAAAQVTCLDERPEALRGAAYRLRRQFRGRCSFVRADARRFAASPARPSQPFDLIYGLSLFEHLGTDQAVQLVQDCHSLLAPAGVLWVGSVTPGVPPGERILRAWLTGWDLQYRDEAAWRGVFALGGFAAARLRFEYEPLRANVLISAEHVA